MAISIVKGVEKITSLIAGISTKSGAYKEAVSSSVLSAVAHSIEHNETSLIDQLFDVIGGVNQRDLIVVKTFVVNLSPFAVEETKEGRKTQLSVTGRKHKALIRGTDEKQADFDKKVKNKKETEVKLIGQFAAFADGKAVFVKNTQFDKDEPVSATNPREVEVNYSKNVFDYYDDIEYMRKAANGEGDETKVYDAVMGMDKVLTSMSGMLKADNVAKYNIDAASVAVMQAAFDMINKHKVSTEKAVIDARALSKVGASDEQRALWVAQRAKRESEGVSAEAITTERRQFEERILAEKAKTVEAEQNAAEAARVTGTEQTPEVITTAEPASEEAAQAE